MLHHNLTVQTTLDSPRFCISADVPDDASKEGDIGTKVYLEDGIRPEVVEELKKMGHDVELLTGHERAMFGRGQVSSLRLSHHRLVEAELLSFSSSASFVSLADYSQTAKRCLGWWQRS